MARTGRPTLLTPELGAKICQRIEDSGCGLDVASECEGINGRQAWLWLSKGRKGQEPYVDFAQNVTRARSLWEVGALERLEDVESNDRDPRAFSAMVKATTWKLERMRRDTYGAAITVKVEEAKEHLLDTLERVCERMGATEVLDQVLQELERGGETEAGADIPEEPALH